MMDNKTYRPYPPKIRKEEIFTSTGKRKKIEDPDSDPDDSFEILDKELIEPVEPILRIGHIEPIEPIESIEPVEHNETIGPIMNVEPIEHIEPTSLDHLLAKRRKLKQILAISNSIEDISNITDSLGKRAKLHAQHLLVTVGITLDELSSHPQQIEPELMHLLNLFIDDAINIVALGTEFDVKFHTWKQSMDKQLSILSDIVACLDKIQRDVDIAKLSGASAGIVGATLAIVGVVMSTVTMGVSLGLTIAGISIGAASGAVSIGARFGGWIHEKKKQKSVQELIETNEQKTQEIIRIMLEVTDLANRTSAVISIDNGTLTHTLPKTNPDCCNVTISVLKTGVGLARGSARVFTALDETLTAAFTASAKMTTKTAGLALTSLGLLVDIIDLIATSQHVHEGSVSEVATKIRCHVIPAVESEIEEIVGLHNRLLRDKEDLGDDNAIT